MRRAAPSLLAVVSLVALAGCGSSPQDGASASASATPAPSATTTTATTPAPSPSVTPKPRTKDEIPKDGSQDFSAPVAAQGRDVEQVPASDGLTLSSRASAATAWTLTAKDDGENGFCVDVHTKGVTDPDPLCNSGTQLALSFFTDQAEAHALADVDLIAPSKTAKPTDIVVAGVAAPDVKDVVVFYAGQRHAAAVTRQGVTLRVDKALAKQILDPTAAQLRSLPSTVTVRAFAVSIPATVANPPSQATPRTETPVNGRMTFDLS